MQRIIAAAALAVASTLATAQGLTLAQAQQSAVERSLQLRAQDARATASLEMAQAADRLPDPVLRLGVDNVPVDGPDRFSLTNDFMTMRRIGVSQEWTGSDKRALRRERFELEAGMVHAERDADLAAIRRNTAVAWLACYYGAKMSAAATRFVEASRAEVEAADAAYRAGRGAQSDVISTRSALALAEDRRIDIERRLRGARLELVRWTGSSATASLAAAPDMSTVHLEHGSLEAHLDRHPEIVALGRRADVAQAEARIAATARHPDWTWEASYQQRGPAYSNMVSIGVSIPLPWDAANRQDRETAARLAQADEALARRDEARRAHISEVGAMLEEWRAGRERQARFHRDIVPLAGEKTSAVLAAFGGARAGLDQVLAARRGELEVELQSLQLDLEVATLWAKLEFLLPDAQLEASR